MHSKLSECCHSVRETSIALRNLEITPFGYNFGLKHNLEMGEVERFLFRIELLRGVN